MRDRIFDQDEDDDNDDGEREKKTTFEFLSRKSLLEDGEKTAAKGTKGTEDRNKVQGCLT